MEANMSQRSVKKTPPQNTGATREARSKVGAMSFM